MKRVNLGVAAACVIAIAALLGTATASGSSARAAADPVHAAVAATPAPPVYFNGHQIDIAHGAAAQLNCVIYLTYGNCFHTVAEMKADEARVAASNTPDGNSFPGAALSGPQAITRVLAISRPLQVLLTSCSTPLSVWTDEGYGGTEKDFAAEQIWRNMSDYGIDNQISSFIVGACNSHLAENANGGGLWYPCDTSAGAHHREMDLDNNNGGPPCAAQSTNWNDRVSSTWVD
jgi:hypothetical protein